MTFITGSITNAAPGPALYAAIETVMLADGWTLVDTVVIGGNTHKVLKSLAAGNTANKDFFLDISFPTTGIATNFYVRPFEDYNPATDLGTRGPWASSNGTVDATTFSRHGATGYALETQWAYATALGSAMTTSAFTYWISVTRSRIIVMVSNEPLYMLYAGLFTPTAAHAAQATTALFPLICAKLIGNNTSSVGSGSAALTRLPRMNLVGFDWLYGVYIHTGMQVTLHGGQAGVNASPLTGQVNYAPIPIVGGAGSSGPASTPQYAAMIGTFDGLATAFISSGAVRGDSVVIGSDSWYATSPNGSVSLFMKGV